MKKIRITSKQYRALSFGYRIGGFFTILGLLCGYAVLIGKPFEFALIFLPYFITKGFYSRQWHANSLKQCFMLSLGIFAFLTTIALPKDMSVLVALILGLLAAYVSYRAGVIQFKLRDYEYIEPRYTAMTEKPFNTDTCTESELIARCRQIRLSDENTALAVEFFIRKTKHSIIADRLSIDEKSVTTRKKRLKIKLNSGIDKC